MCGHRCYNVTMLHVTCYVKEVALRPSASRREGGEGRGRSWQEGRSDRSGLGWRARGIVVRIGENVFVAVVFAVRSALLLTFLLFSDVVRKKKRNFAIDI